MQYALVALGIILLIFAVRAGLVWFSVDRYAKHWSELAKKPPQENAITYIALGDSLAQGVGASRAENGYVGKIAREIEKQTGRPVQVLNFSKSGAKVAEVTRDQIPKLQNFKNTPEVIITLDIGTNDVTRGSYQGEPFVSELDTLFSQLPKQTIISDMPYLGKSRWQSADPNIVTGNKILRETATKHGFELVPMYENLKAKNSLAVYSGDFFHPSNYGYSIWFDGFWPQVKQQLKHN